MQVVHGLFGLAVLCFAAWLMSSHKKRVPWRILFGGLVTQFALALLLLETETGQRVFRGAADFVSKLIGMTEDGATMVFGPLADPAKLEGAFGADGSFIFAFAGKGLVAIIFFSALMSMLYHLGIMQRFVWLLAHFLSRTLRVSGSESTAMAANVFVGQTEAPLVVKPYLATMTKSELNALMTGGFATIAGSVMAVYVGLFGETDPAFASHLLTASVMSAPAAFVVAKLMQPETEVSPTAGKVTLHVEKNASNLIEAATNGTQDGLKLWLNVIAMLIAFVALVALVDWPLGALGEALGMESDLSLGFLFGQLLAPLAWCMGVESWHDCQLFGSLLGTKVAVNEFVAFFGLLEMSKEGAEVAFRHERSAHMAAYALCGFANFGSVGIQIGGISPIAPNRKTDLSRLALRAMLGGALASWMTATIAGIFL